MDRNNSDKQKDSYGAFKVSEYTHQGKGKGYKVDESTGVPARAETMSEMAAKLEAEADGDFKKKHKLGKDKEEYKAEYKTTRDALRELSPFDFKRQLDEVKGLTPEEYETVLRALEEVKMNAKLHACAFTTAAVGFTHWQRHVLPRSFYPFAFCIGMAAGGVFGLIRTGSYIAESVDALGKDYEIARMMKQDIFDTRPDLDSGMRAQYYIHQQNQRYEWEKKHENKN